MKYAYFPGCSLSSTGLEYNLSTKRVAEVFGIDLWEIPDWNCCGASSAHLADPLLALALPARNLAIAEEAGLDVAIPCAACYARSKAVEVEVLSSAEMAQTISEVIERKYSGQSKARSLLDIFVNDLGVNTIQTMVNKPLSGLKVLCYYGCLLVRPQKTGFDDPEDPQSMDILMRSLGANALDWAFKTECCGAAHATCDADLGLPMIAGILEAAHRENADCLVTACPLCMNNLDMRQKQAGRLLGQKFDLPVFYFTELLGLALSLKPEELGIHKHFTKTDQVLRKLNNLWSGGRTE